MRIDENLYAENFLWRVPSCNHQVSPPVQLPWECAYPQTDRSASVLSCPPPLQTKNTPNNTVLMVASPPPAAFGVPLVEREVFLYVV